MNIDVKSYPALLQRANCALFIYSFIGQIFVKHKLLPDTLVSLGEIVMNKPAFFAPFMELVG